jgi:hypothetical protein
MQEMNAQPLVSKSIYVFLVISIACAVVSAIVGSLIIIKLSKLAFYESMNVSFWPPIILSCIGLLSGLIVLDKAKVQKFFRADGCIISFSIYFNAMVLVLYILSFLGIGYFLAQVWA